MVLLKTPVCKGALVGFCVAVMRLASYKSSLCMEAVNTLLHVWWGLCNHCIKHNGEQVPIGSKLLGLDLKPNWSYTIETQQPRTGEEACTRKTPYWFCGILIGLNLNWTFELLHRIWRGESFFWTGHWYSVVFNCKYKIARTILVPRPFSLKTFPLRQIYSSGPDLLYILSYCGSIRPLTTCCHTLNFLNLCL